MLLERLSDDLLLCVLDTIKTQDDRTNRMQRRTLIALSSVCKKLRRVLEKDVFHALRLSHAVTDLDSLENHMQSFKEPWISIDVVRSIDLELHIKSEQQIRTPVTMLPQFFSGFKQLTSLSLFLPPDFAQEFWESLLVQRQRCFPQVTELRTGVYCTYMTHFCPRLLRYTLDSPSRRVDDTYMPSTAIQMTKGLSRIRVTCPCKTISLEGVSVSCVNIQVLAHNAACIESLDISQAERLNLYFPDLSTAINTFKNLKTLILAAPTRFNLSIDEQSLQGHLWLNTHCGELIATRLYRDCPRLQEVKFIDCDVEIGTVPRRGEGFLGDTSSFNEGKRFSQSRDYARLWLGENQLRPLLQMPASDWVQSIAGRLFMHLLEQGGG